MSFTRAFVRILAALIASVAITSCGGGGSDSDIVANHALSGSSGGSAIGTGSTDDGSGGLAFTGDPARAWTWTTAEPSQATWSPVIGLSLVPAAASNLPDGRVLLWSAEQRLSFNDPGRTYTTIFDPVAGRATERLVTETGHDMFCPGTTNLPDGRLLVSGGIDSGNVSIFDPVNSSWTSAAQMNIPRGYHSNVLTADGGVLVLGGSWSGGVGNKNGEIWTPSTGWRLLPGVPVDPMVGPDPGGMYRADNHLWLFATADQRVFHAGPSVNMTWITTAGNGSVMAAGARGDDVYSQNGSAAMYGIGRILKTGGAPAYENAAATTSSYMISLGAEASVRKLAPMAFPRAFHNSVVLPNGQVLVIGGQGYAVPFTDDWSVLEPELWDPASRRFTRMPPMSVPRNYHGVALLMADGRVVVSGSGLCGEGCATNHPNLQILTPPYLLDGHGSPAVRPIIITAPTQAALGSTIAVSTDAGIATFVLMRLSSTTHTVNNDQRRIPLTHQSSSPTTHSVTIPSNPGIAPPGDYMLFALNVDGVPSVSRLIRIAADGAPRLGNPGTVWSSRETPADLALAATSSGGAITWSASGLPPGLALEASGRVVGTPTTVGSYRVTVTAHAAAAAATTDFQWNVTDAAAARFVKLEALSAIGGGQWTSVAEFDVLDPSGVAMPRSGWTASADSFEPINPATNVLDGGVGSLWHTTYSATTAPLPHWLVVDMKTPRVVGGFRYLPRQDGSTNGTIGQYRFSISADGSAWRQVAAGDFSQWQTGTAAKTIVLGNVAAGKPATQSSGDPATAARAVDGNPSGTLADGSVALTAAQAAPWWQVDLGAVHALNTIRLWNRGDCCADQLADVTVFVSRTDMTGRSLASLAADPAVWRYQIVGRAGRETLIRGNAHGRYLRVQIAGTDALALAEVEAYGAVDEGGTPNLDDPRDVISERGQAVTFALSAGDPGGGALRFSAGNLPQGLQIDPRTGLIGGTPSKTGASVITVSARNVAGHAVETTFTWIVTEPALRAVSLAIPRLASLSSTSADPPGSPSTTSDLAATRLAATTEGTATTREAVLAPVRPASTPDYPARSEAARRGAALFNGQVPLAGRIAGHDRDLPSSVTRCAGCHEGPASTSPSVAKTAVPGTGTAGPQSRGVGSGTFGPSLDARSLLEPKSRRGGPPSRFDSATFCTLLRSGVDAASIVVAQQMPRYDLTDEACTDLWAWVNERR